MIPYILLMLMIVVYFFSLGKIFEKNGRQTWEGYAPVYNIYVWLKIIKKPWWWIFFFPIPFVNLIVAIGCNVETYVGNTITPHNNCSTFTHLSQNIEFVKTTPFMGRMYTYDIFKLLIDKSQLYDLMNVFNDIKYIFFYVVFKRSRLIIF